MAEKYSAGWISKEIGQRAWLPLRECSLCGTEVGYVVNKNSVWFRSDCGCTLYSAPDRASSWDEIAKTLAMQTSDEVRDGMMARMLGNA